MNCNYGISLNSHHCSASSKSLLWWCKALSISPSSIKAFPIQLCRLPNTSFLLGTSFSDHFCTTFMTSSAFLRLPSAFPDVSAVTTVQLVPLRLYRKHQVHAEAQLTFINVIQALQQKLSRFKRWILTALATFLLHFQETNRFLLAPELSASV